VSAGQRIGFNDGLPQAGVMSGSDPSKAADQADNDDQHQRPGDSWRNVEPEIWKGGKGAGEFFHGRFLSRFGRILRIFSSAEFLVFVLAPVGGLSIYLTFFLAYSLGGLRFFGVYLIGMWSAVIVGVVVVLERTGYARNFEGWDFPLRRILVLPVVFGLAAGLILLMVYLAGAFH